MNRKWVMGVLCVMLIVLAAACGKSADPAPTGTASSPDSGTEVKETTIRMAAWYPEDKIAPVLAEYEKQHSGIKIEYVELVDNEASDEAMKKLDMLVASGDDLDVALLPGVTDYSKRAGLNLLAPLNDLIKEEGLTLSDEYTVDTAIGGNYYALPDTFENYFVLLNKDMLDAANLPVPTEWTWDDYLEYSKKLTSGTGPAKVYGTYFHTWPMYWQLGLMNQSKENNLVNDGKVKIDSAEVRKSLEIRYQAEYTDQSAVPYADTISQKLAYRPVYFTQKAAMIVSGNWMITDAGGTKEFPATFTTAFAPMPSNVKGEPSGVSLANGNYMGILAKSKKQKEAYDFIRWYTTKGEEMKNVYSAWKKQDVDQLIKAVKEKALSPDKIDAESLSYVIKNSKTAALNIPPTYQTELEDAYVKDAEKYILKQQDLETTIKNAQANLQKIVDANK
ncbi:ABC transporter substrate-binding protein [Paenibacillus eucommiae]|uniref:Multiple sugar transport system substrate-binding protein n=1 Tax=Paenibacillus eucommiae TaxID=1355755 RepID=A0ABS4J7Z4_9BACL|nr:extracellular solute-binding protein [Paenibacillus eucommiae]MBP1995977.1 multiple sugar transport system substrate-binding protein [Paenibacillus eucommiae]